MATPENQNPSKPHSVRYAPPFGAIAAIDPSALDIEILLGPEPPKPAYGVAGGKAMCLEISGPLCYAHPFLDTYAGIRSRFDVALQGGHEAVILKLNTPGGDVAGAFDLSRYMRAAAAAAGKRLIAFTESQCCSAGYALGCAADTIVCSDTATLGSVGVITCLQNTSAAEKALGLSYAIISSGERKADGNPHQALSDEARAAIAAGVNAMAGVFFSYVAERRGGLDAQPLQGGTRVGAGAQSAGLCDAVMSFDALCASLEGGAEADKPGAIQAMMADEDKDKDKPDARKALAAAAEAGDEKAKRALAAYDADPPKDDDKDKGKKAEDDKPEPKDDDKDKATAAVAAATSAQATAMSVQLQAQGAELAQLKAESEQRKAADAAAERARILATRPDLAAEALKALDAVPTAQLTAVLAQIPVRYAPPELARQPLVGTKDAVAGVSYLSGPEVCAALDKAAGLAPEKLGVVNRGPEQIFGAPLPKGSN